MPAPNPNIHHQTPNTMVKTHLSGTQEGIVINQLDVRSADRSNKDILSWRNALTTAESIQFPNRTRLYDLYEDILLDGHLTGVLSKRIDAVLNKDLYFERNGTKDYSFDELIRSQPFRKVVQTIIETVFWGISGIEFLPGTQLSFQKIPRKHIRPDVGMITYQQNGTEGIPYTSLSNVWIMGDAADLGLLLKCAPLCLYKRGGLADWAEYIEIFGQPMRIIRYDSYDEQTKAELRKILDHSGSSLSVMLPRQADFEIKDGKQSNSDGDLQLSFIKMLNDELSVLVLGNTDTTTSSHSSGYAQSKIHLQQQYEITRSDLSYVSGMLNHPHFTAILNSYGYPVVGGKFVFSKDMDIEYLTQRIVIDKAVAEQVSIPASYWYDTYGIKPY